MAEALEYTLQHFGEAKYLDYLSLIGSAIAALEADPQAGRRRPEIHPEAWTLHIARPGLNARHLLLLQR